MNFRPSAMGILLTLAGVGLFSTLGSWQLNRAEEKRLLQASIEAQQQKPPIEYRGQAVEDVRFRQIRVQGRYLADEQLLMDSRTHDGQVGYDVITPLQVAGNENIVVLVNRGWLPAGRDRQVLPEVEVPQGLLLIEGRADQPRSRPVIAEERPETDLAKRWTWLDLQYFHQVSGLETAPFIILLSPEMPGGLVRDWPEFESRVGMHIGYAIQWFAFALIALGTFIGVAFKRSKPGNTKQ